MKKIWKMVQNYIGTEHLGFFLTFGQLNQNYLLSSKYKEVPKPNQFYNILG